MGSPLVAMIGLSLGFALIYAGVKNVSVIDVFKGDDVTAAPNAQTNSNTNSGVQQPANKKAQ